MTTPELPVLHPFAEVAEKYDIPFRSLRDAAYAREFDHIRIGTTRFFTDEQLAAYLKSRTVTSSRSEALAKTRDRLARRPRGRKAAA